MPSSDPSACSRCGLSCPVGEPEELELWAAYWGLLVCPPCLTPTEIAALDGRPLADSTAAPAVVASDHEEADDDGQGTGMGRASAL